VASGHESVRLLNDSTVKLAVKAGIELSFRMNTSTCKIRAKKKTLANYTKLQYKKCYYTALNAGAEINRNIVQENTGNSTSGAGQLKRKLRQLD